MPCLERREDRCNTRPIVDGKELAVDVFLLRARASVSLGIWPGLVEEAGRDGPGGCFSRTV